MAKVAFISRGEQRSTANNSPESVCRTAIELGSIFLLSFRIGSQTATMTCPFH